MRVPNLNSPDCSSSDVILNHRHRAVKRVEPDYLALKARGLSHTRASLTIARKLARRSFHVLRELGPAALEPIPTS